MNELKVFSSSEFGELGVMLIEGKEFFPATQCARVLGYVNPYDAIKKHCREEGVAKREGVSYTTNQHGVTSQQISEIKYIDEGNLYRLIVRSQLPAAEKFERWVFDEVLPSIRKNGAYTPNLEELIAKTATAVVSEVMKQLIPVILKRNTDVEDDDFVEEIVVQKKRHRRQPKSAIACLAPDLREEIEEMLLDCRYSYDDITEYLRKKRIKISRSAVGRYYQWLTGNLKERTD